MAIPDNVKLVKFPEMDEVDSALFLGTLERFFNKIGEGSKLELSLKQYAKGGLRVQHELRAKLALNGGTFYAERTGWLLMEVIQDTLKILEKEVKKKESFKK